MIDLSDQLNYFECKIRRDEIAVEILQDKIGIAEQMIGIPFEKMPPGREYGDSR